MKKLIECVPNFSEGRDMAVIKQITDEVEKVDGVKLLDVDPGYSTNRTVVTFVGTPDEVIEAAFQAVKKAQELIDMRRHKGDHPRFGATDVCPLVPISGVTMKEVGGICSQTRQTHWRRTRHSGLSLRKRRDRRKTPQPRQLPRRRVRRPKGQDRFAEWKPDFGPAEFNESVARSGAVAVGARDFLIAVNFNLNTTSTRRANAIAFDVREKGRAKREGNPITGKIVNGRKRRARDDPRHAQRDKSHRLVHRGIRHRAGFDEYHQPLRNAAAYCL